MKGRTQAFKLAVLCGGPSPERGISLNSARSVCDHLESPQIEIIPVYFDYNAKPYRIARDWMYSNTPSDFDFKLAHMAHPLTDNEFTALLEEVDMCFPVMHGKFGEDGEIQRILEEYGCNYIGSPSESCQLCFDKYDANEFIKNNGFYTLPSIAIDCDCPDYEYERRVLQFFKDHQLKRAIVKPSTGGSSIGVFSVNTPIQACKKIRALFADGFYHRVVVEKFCDGIEFTAVLVQNRSEAPVALMPVEIEADYTSHQIFDYRKKYLPTRQVVYHCPPNFDDDTVAKIQEDAEQLFDLFNMRDFARFDGWVLKDGNIWFSDFNPVSGMEQNSFLFLQAARIGMSHRDLLKYILTNAALRCGLKPPFVPEKAQQDKQPVNVIFGGDTAERHVSVMSGTNAWLKLCRSDIYNPQPHLLDMHGQVWDLPYSLALNHTAEEIYDSCIRARDNEARNSKLRAAVVKKLDPKPGDISQTQFIPKQMSLNEFIEKSNTVVVGLHGGYGEDGRFQKKLDDAGIQYNGPGSEASRICMDKYEVGLIVEGMQDPKISTANRHRIFTEDLKTKIKENLAELWGFLCAKLQGPPILVKPSGDGCSAGIVLLHNQKDLVTYFSFLENNICRIPPDSLTNQSDIVEMPITMPEALLFEHFIVTDKLCVVNNELSWEHKTGWVEITAAVLGPEGKMKALNPSITVASGDILSVEEKFQGGTGVNITPPPTEYVPENILTEAKQGLERVAERVGLEGYARIDAFLNIEDASLIIIEVNTLPALTPSTVLFHQALAEDPPMYPVQLLEHIMSNKMTE